MMRINFGARLGEARRASWWRPCPHGKGDKASGSQTAVGWEVASGKLNDHSEKCGCEGEEERGQQLEGKGRFGGCFSQETLNVLQS